MNIKNTFPLILFLFIFQSSHAQNSDSIDQMVIDEFKKYQTEEVLKSIWKSNFGLEYEEEYSTFQVKGTQGNYWLISLGDTRHPSKVTILRRFLSDIVRPDEAGLLPTPETIPLGESYQRDFDSVDTCKELEAKLSRQSAKESKTFSCIKTVPNEKSGSLENESSLPLSPSAAAIPSCIVGKWHYNRSGACGVGRWVINIYTSQGELVGLINLFTQQEITLNPYGSRTSENFKILFTSASGVWQGSTINASANCSGICSATSNLPNGEVIVVPSQLDRQVTYSNSIVGVHSFPFEYAMSSGPIVIRGVRWGSPTVRCDSVGQGSGCVFPDIEPVITTMKSPGIPQITANIRHVQSVGPNHYGRLSDGKPIVRSTSTTVERNNRNAACPPPDGTPKPSDDYNCDEYPFAVSFRQAPVTFSIPLLNIKGQLPTQEIDHDIRIPSAGESR